MDELVERAELAGPAGRQGRELLASGNRLAAEIPAARFVPLQSRNHLILENEPAFARFLQEIRAFLPN
jgi:hypothetical protein